MKFSIERAVFLKTLHHIQGIVEKKQTVSVLSNVLLQAEGETLTMKATDRDIVIEEKLVAHISASGTTTVSAHLLYGIVQKLHDGCLVDISLEENGRLIIQSDRSRFTLPTIPHSEFPVITAIEGDLGFDFSISHNDFKELLNRTKFAMSSEDTRYYLNGIYLHSVQKNDTFLLRSVATDGHRLALHEVTMDENIQEMPSVIIPRKTVSEIHKLINEFEGDVSIQVSPTKILFSFGDITLLSKLIDGTFPDYEQVIPKNNTFTMTADKAPLIKAVDRVSLLSSDKTRGIKVSLQKDTLHLSATQNNGEASEDMTVTYDGDTLTTGFNSRYLLDAMEHAPSDVIAFSFGDENAPVMITAPKQPSEQTATLFVIMPMRM